VSRSRSRTARTRVVVLATCLGLVGAACAGPEAALVVGMNDRTVDIVLGERVRVVTEVIPPAMPVRVTVPRSRPAPLPPPPLPSPITFEPGPCAPPAQIEIAEEDSALSPPKAPPAEATYEYDTAGVVLFVDPDQSEGLPTVPPEEGDIPLNAAVLPLKTTRTVTDVVAEPAAAGVEPYTFDVVWDAGERSSTASYRIVIGEPVVPPPSDPTGSLPPETDPALDRAEGAPAGPTQPGLYLTQSDRQSASGFHPPAPGMKLVDFPVEGGATFAATSSDGVTTIDYTSTVGFSPVVINACGTWVEGWPVKIEGTVVSAETAFLGHQLARFEGEYLIAPQFGGLVLDENVMVTTPSDGQTVAAVPIRISTVRIAQAPQRAGGDGS